MRPDRSTPKKPERRKDKDWMVQGSTILCVLAWMLSFFALLVIDLAAPTQANMFTHLMGGQERVTWNEAFILLAYIMLVLSVISCVTSLTFNVMRMKRSHDKLKISVLVINVLTIAGFIFFTFNFVDILF